jgi:hypothetical protein
MHILFSLEEKIAEAHMIENFQSFLKLRPRSNWEACDSGILIWRNSIAYILFFMGLPFLFCAIALIILNPHLQFFGILILWWLKPFFDRFILQVISVRFFKNNADYKTIRKGLIKNIFTGLIGDLTWRRFSLYRSARMPARILEGNKGKMIHRRIKNLKNGGLDFCALLTSLCIILELVLFFIFAFFLYGFFAEYANFSFDLFLDYTSQVSFAVLILSSLIFLITEPLYMCMGFGIYINSRSIVEGWDIEWTFNLLINEKKSTNKNILRTSIVLFFISVLFLFNFIQPAELHADEWHQNNSEEVPTKILDEVLSSEDFGSSETKRWIRFKEIDFGEPSSPFQFNENNVKEIIGFILRALLVIIIFAAIIFFAYRLFKMKNIFSQNKFTPWKKNIIPGFANQEDPDTLIHNAKIFFAEGQIRKAWAACLSAIFTLYAEKGNIIFALNDTESDCLTKINCSALWGKEESAQLILYWIKLAYAGIEPDRKYFDEAISFYDELKNKLSSNGDTNE